MDTTKIESNIDDAANLLKALSNDRRLMIMCALNHGEKSVGDLEKVVGLSQSALSQHLARLRRDNLVRTRRSAQTIYYSSDSPRAGAVLDCLCTLFEDDTKPTEQ